MEQPVESTDTSAPPLQAGRDAGASMTRLADLLRAQRALLLRRWEEALETLEPAARTVPPRLSDEVPRLIDALANGTGSGDGTAVPASGRNGDPEAADDAVCALLAEHRVFRGCLHELLDASEADGAALPADRELIDRALDAHLARALRALNPGDGAEGRTRLAYVAHDIRTPLNAISLALEVLERQAPALSTDATAVRMMRSLRRNVAQLENLVARQLEAPANAHAAEPVPVPQRLDLAALLRTVAQELAPVERSSGVRLLVQAPDTLDAQADPTMIARVLRNLVANALQHAGCTVVTLGAEMLADGTVRCRVADDGVGIAPEMLANLFERGVSGGDRATRSGLGLAIVKQFVEAHGACVRVDSAPGEGATFHFDLPPPPRG